MDESELGVYVLHSPVSSMSSRRQYQPSLHTKRRFRGSYELGDSWRAAKNGTQEVDVRKLLKNLTTSKERCGS